MTIAELKATFRDAPEDTEVYIVAATEESGEIYMTISEVRVCSVVNDGDLPNTDIRVVVNG